MWTGKSFSLALISTTTDRSTIIHAETGIDTDISISHGQDHLMPDRQAACPEFASKALLVDGLQQRWTERPMHLEGGIDNLARDRIFLGGRLNRLCGSSAAEVLEAWIGSTILGSVGEDKAYPVPTDTITCIDVPCLFERLPWSLTKINYPICEIGFSPCIVGASAPEEGREEGLHAYASRRCAANDAKNGLPWAVWR